MKIKFISVESSDKKTKTGKDYVEIEVTYKNIDFQEKVESKKLNPFGNKDVYNTLKSAKQGDFFEVERSKNDAGFWDWIGIGSVSGGNSAPEPITKATGGAGYTSPKSTYETPEERAKKQVYIVRQSSISAAIDTLKTDKKAPTKEEVVDLAKYYEAYVFGVDQQPVPLADLPAVDTEDDIPC